MIGILVDTEIIKLLIKKYIPSLTPILEEKDGYLGDFIGTNFINRGLTNLFSNSMMNKDVSLLIWDYLFLEGNKVLFKAFLAIYKFLSVKLLKGERSLENYNSIMNNDLKTLSLDNEDFIYDLFFLHDKSISEMDFTEYRFYLSLEVSDTLEQQNIEHVKSKVKLSYDQKLYNRELNKIKTCNKKWPYCISDNYFENVTKIVFYTVFHENNNKCIENYFFNEDDNKELRNKDKKYNYYDMRIERRQHYCSEIQNEINSKEGNNEGNTPNENEDNKINIEETNKIEESQQKKDFINKVITKKNFVNITKVIGQKMDEHINASIINIPNNQ